MKKHGKQVNQNKLAVIAKGSNRDAGEAALEKLTDRELLSDVAKNAHFDHIQVAAVEELTSQEMLLDVAENGGSRYARMAAVKRLTDLEKLVQIAQNDLDENVRITAFEKLTTQDALETVARNCVYNATRMMAADALADRTIAEEIYADILRRGGSADLMKAVFQKITDHKILSEIAESRDDKYLLRWTEQIVHHGGYEVYHVESEKTVEFDLRKAARKKLRK